MLNKANNWFVNQFVYKKQAKNIVKYFTEGYSVGKAEQPDWSQMDILIRLSLGHDELFRDTFGSSKEFLEECCQTINGACYLMAVWPDIVYGIQEWRIQQMVKYIDRELILHGFTSQYGEQKERILNAINKFKFQSE
jgi:hypothetical protein